MGKGLWLGIAAAVGVVLLLVVAVLRQNGAEETSASPTVTTNASAPSIQSYDAIVVGSGIGGLSAAYELGKGGANVLVIDMASIFGGHAVMATGDLCLVDTPFQREHGVHDSPDIAYKDFFDWGEDPNPEWVRYYVDHSREQIYDWLTSLGVTFEKLVSPAGNSVQRTHRTKGRGIGLVTPIFEECARRSNIAFRFNTKVEHLLTEGGRVVGVATKSTRSEEKTELRAHLVVLATGGFQSNLDMVRQAWTKDVPFPEHFLIGSGMNSLGSGHELAKEAGAALLRLDHQWNYITGLPDPRYPGLGRGLNAVNPDSVWVNAQGKRFIAERSSAKVGFPVIARLDGSTYWSIFDEPAKKSFWIAGSDWASWDAIEKQIFGNPDLVKSAPTLGELCKKVGLPAAAVQATIERWNQMVAQGNDVDFGRFGPGKDYKPHAIGKPPFYAVQFFPLTRKSMGGVAIDTQGHALDAQSHVIPGLYAVGELTGLAGINGKAALEGTFLGPSMLIGRVAGRTALAEIGSKAAPPILDVPPATALSEKPAQSSVATCTSCHPLAQQVDLRRDGYWHFEKVHHVVLERGYDCMQCHGELAAPFAPETHHFNRMTQAHVCPYCHAGEDR